MLGSGSMEQVNNPIGTNDNETTSKLTPHCKNYGKVSAEV